MNVDIYLFGYAYKTLCFNCPRYVVYMRSKRPFSVVRETYCDECAATSSLLIAEWRDLHHGI